MNTSEAIVKLLEEFGIKHIFGHPGEQILPFYKALHDSEIEHILTRHEQGAIHAADGYARSSGKIGACLSTAGPGALNLTMGIATAFKDSVPLLIITGDNPKNLKKKDNFQDCDIVSVFNPITVKNFNPNNGKIAIKNIKEALEIFKKKPSGPIHINLSKDVLLDEDIENLNNQGSVLLDKDIENLNNQVFFSPNYDYNNLDKVIESIKNSKRPIIIAGNGIMWGNAIDLLKTFAYENKIPIATTYHSRGIISENDKLNLGIAGIRGTSMSNYAINNCDLILAFGSKLSERTLDFSEESLWNSFFLKKYKSHDTKVIHVNIEKNSLKGDMSIYGDIKFVLNKLVSLNKITNNLEEDWLDKIHQNNHKIAINDYDYNDNEELLKPQIAINEILNYSKNYHIVNDAGSHTTWVNLLIKGNIPRKLIYSGGMAPMGYGLPASCGVAIANKNKNVILINGDGGFQMNIQELATIRSNNLPILICILNNFQLGIIRQWEEMLSKDLRYEVDLENPDFVSLGNSYGIDSVRVKTRNDLKIAIEKGLSSNKPYLIDIIVEEEDIPLPKSFNK